MLKGIDLSQRIDFTFSDDSDPKTVVVLRPLSGVEMAELSNFKEGDEVKVTAGYIVNMLAKTIVEIRNFPNEGDIIASNEKELVNKFINGLSVKSLGEIMGEITKINNLTRQDSKNS